MTTLTLDRLAEIEAAAAKAMKWPSITYDGRLMGNVCDPAAARADAERYRKLRSSAYKIYLFHNGEHYTVELPSPGYFPPSEFDAAIDRMLAGKDAT